MSAQEDAVVEAVARAYHETPVDWESPTPWPMLSENLRKMVRKKTIAAISTYRLAKATQVCCVICIAGDGSDVTHIFSTYEKRQSFMDADRERNHVAYDYIIDCPDCMEGRPQ